MTCSWTNDLPRGLEREHVYYHGHDYTLRGSETRTLTNVGAFRVVRADDLRDKFDKPLDRRHGELWHLRQSGLVHTARLDRDTTVVRLTKDGRDLLDARRLDEDSRERQAFHHGIQKPRELRLGEEGANIHPVTSLKMSGSWRSDRSGDRRISRNAMVGGNDSSSAGVHAISSM